MMPKAVILAAGVGSRLRPLTDKVPKCLVEVARRPLLGRMLDALADAGFTEVSVVAGYLKGQVDRFVAEAPIPCKVIDNPRYDTANNYYSLLVARSLLEGHDFVKLDGDVIVEKEVLRRVVEGPGEIRLAVDQRPGLGKEEMKVLLGPDGRITRVSKELDPTASAGESMGVEWISASASRILFQELARMEKQGLDNEYYEYAYDMMARAGRDLRPADVTGLRIIEIDDPADLEQAEGLF